MLSFHSGGVFERCFLSVRWRSSLVVAGEHEPGLDKLLAGPKFTQRATAREWNELLQDQDAILIDARNGYEQEVGRFAEKQAEVGVGSSKFSLQISETLERFKETVSKDRKIIMCCTSGIRCEKLSLILEVRKVSCVRGRC